MLRQRSNFAIPLHQADIQTANRVVYTTAESAIPSTFDGSDVVFRVLHEQQQVSDNKVIEFTLSETGASNDVEVCSAPFFCSEIMHKRNNGNTKVMRSYPEASLFHHVAGQEDQKQNNNFLKQIGLNSSYWKDGNIKAGSTRKFYLRLFELDDDVINSYIKNDKGYSEIILTLAKNVKVAGSGVVGISNIRILTTDIRIPASLESKLASDLNTEVARRVLYWTEVKETPTLTASTEYELDLNKVKGDVPFLLLAIRDSGYSATNSTNIKFHSLGDDSTINFKSHDKEILSLGQNMPVDYLVNQVWHSQCSSDFNGRNMYLIPFCRNAMASLKGHKNGYFRFDGSKQNVLHITPGPAGTACVQRVTVNAAMSAGSYKLSFRGELTDSLAYDATTAAIKAALEALNSFQNYDGKPLTVTVGSTLAATTTTDFTFDASAVPPNNDLIQVVLDSTAAGATESSTALQTTGKQGWTTGSYDVRVYAGVYHTVTRKGGEYKISMD